MSERASVRPELDALIVGAGFAGLAMLHQLRQLGLRVRVLERGSGIGGTWFWNRYPGARCDVESMEYSYQFSDALQQEWEWSERYAAQPEILRYLEHVAERFDLRRDIALDTPVRAARFDERTDRWQLETASGERWQARFCIMATGCLSNAHTPRFPGLEDFAGETYHTGRWPHAPVDFRGKRVGVIGTGSSAVQSIPLIAEQAARLYVFQRTATYTIPAHNRPLTPEQRARIKADYAGLRRRAALLPFGLDTRPSERVALETPDAERRAEFAARWAHGGLPFLSGFTDLLTSQAANDTAAEFVRAKIRESVRDPRVASLLSPSQVLGCKRLCIDTGYYATFNRSHVTLVDVREAPIEAITRQGLRTRDADYALDCIVFATGFDAMTGALLGIDIQGRGGLPLARKWAEGPRSYLGLASAGFPNLFLITGPGSPSVLSNMVPSIEQHAGWIARCIAWLREQARGRIEASVAAEDAWVAHVNEVAGATLFPTCNSWYLGANVPGKPRVFMPYLGFPEYVRKCDEVAARGYEGFTTA